MCDFPTLSSTLSFIIRDWLHWVHFLWIIWVGGQHSVWFKPDLTSSGMAAWRLHVHSMLVWVAALYSGLLPQWRRAQWVLCHVILLDLVYFLKHLCLNLTDVIEDTASPDDIRNIHYVHIQALHDAPPPALQSSKGTLNHPGSAQSLTEAKLVICEPPCVSITLHGPAA